MLSRETARADLIRQSTNQIAGVELRPYLRLSNLGEFFSNSVHRATSNASVFGIGWKRLRVQGQLVRNLIGRQEARAVCTESACGLFQLNHRISDRFGGKVEILSGCTLAAKGAFQPSGCEQSE